MDKKKLKHINKEGFSPDDKVELCGMEDGLLNATVKKAITPNELHPAQWGFPGLYDLKSICNAQLHYSQLVLLSFAPEADLAAFIRLNATQYDSYTINHTKRTDAYYAQYAEGWAHARDQKYRSVKEQDFDKVMYWGGKQKAIEEACPKALAEGDLLALLFQRDEERRYCLEAVFGLATICTMKER
jgi:hypothetical protein